MVLIVLLVENGDNNIKVRTINFVNLHSVLILSLLSSSPASLLSTSVYTINITNYRRWHFHYVYNSFSKEWILTVQSDLILNLHVSLTRSYSSASSGQ